MHVSGEQAEFNLGVLAEDAANPYRLQCRQAILSWALANEQPWDALRFDALITAVFQDDKSVSVKLNNEFIRGSALIGYDGARSLVREAIGANFEGATYPENTILVTTYFPFQEHLKDLSGMNIFGKKEVPIHFWDCQIFGAYHYILRRARRQNKL